MRRVVKSAREAAWLDFSRSCEWCGHTWSERRLITGEYEDYYSYEQKIRAKAEADFEKNRHRVESGVTEGCLCPQCSRFSSRALLHNFPAGERTAVLPRAKLGLVILVLVGSISTAFLAVGAHFTWGYTGWVCGIGVIGTIAIAIANWRRDNKLLGVLSQMTDDEIHSLIVEAYKQRGSLAYYAIDHARELALQQAKQRAQAAQGPVKTSVAPVAGLPQAAQSAPAVNKCSCPACSRRLVVKRTPPSGSVRCPACGARFTLSAAASAPSQAVGAAKPLTLPVPLAGAQPKAALHSAAGGATDLAVRAIEPLVFPKVCACCLATGQLTSLRRRVKEFALSYVLWICPQCASRRKRHLRHSMLATAIAAVVLLLPASAWWVSSVVSAKNDGRNITVPLLGVLILGIGSPAIIGAGMAMYKILNARSEVRLKFTVEPHEIHDTYRDQLVAGKSQLETRVLTVCFPNRDQAEAFRRDNPGKVLTESELEELEAVASFLVHGL